MGFTGFGAKRGLGFSVPEATDASVVARGRLGAQYRVQNKLQAKVQFRVCRILVGLEVQKGFACAMWKRNSPRFLRCPENYSNGIPLLSLYKYSIIAPKPCSNYLGAFLVGSSIWDSRLRTRHGRRFSHPDARAIFSSRGLPNP